MLSRAAAQIARRPTVSLLSKSPQRFSQPTFARSYALSRFPDRNGPASSRLRSRPGTKPSTIVEPGPTPQVLEPSSESVINDNRLLLGANPDSGGLERLLANDALVVTRQIEMMNIFMGFEVANRYAINDVNGNVVGYIAEEERGLFGTMARQLFRTHRAFRSVIMDVNGTPVLWIHRPFSWINSRLYVQRKVVDESPAPGAEELSLIKFGEARQQWHPWRRKYHLFLGRDGSQFHQFAEIDSGLFAWDFFLQNEMDVNLGSIRKGWTGVGRELFTDTSQYTIRFTPDPSAPSAQETVNEDGTVAAPVYKPLSLEERALVLALSVGIDFDYFSRHSEGSGFTLPFLWIFASIE
ncbi:hypothetical protein FRB99_005914 [Tulasnella sp. 403]|nr:hypothetical protein FRB99_005914 [Tulasnella sp. 403]